MDKPAIWALVAAAVTIVAFGALVLMFLRALMVLPG
jgi:hypothetical protein